MLFSHTHGEMRVKRSLLKTWTKVPGETRLDMRSFGSVENRLDWIACDTFGLTPVVSTSQTKSNSPKSSVLCSAGITTQLTATSTYRTYLVLPLAVAVNTIHGHGTLNFTKADGLLVVGR